VPWFGRQGITRGCNYSFGYKYGLTVVMEVVLDVRFIPNTLSCSELKHADGHSNPKGAIMCSKARSAPFVGRSQQQLAFLHAAVSSARARVN